MEQNPTTVDVESLNVRELSDDDLRALSDKIQREVTRRESDANLDPASSAGLVSGQWVKWSTLSAHPNTKAVKPWILHVTDTHEKYGVDGDWLGKQTIDGDHHMNVGDLEAGDIIKVSGASHSNKKHRYYEIVARTDDELYYDQVSESDVIEAVDA